MHIELKSNDLENHKAFDNFKNKSKGGVVILNERANDLDLQDIKAYAELVFDFQSKLHLPLCSLTKAKELKCPIHHKRDKLANEQRYKGRYDNSCWLFSFDDITEDNLLLFTQYIFDKYKQICLAYSCNTKNVYEFSNKTLTKADKIIVPSLELIKNYDLIKRMKTKEKLNQEIIKDRKYIVYKFNLTKAYRDPIFVDHGEHTILKAVVKNTIYFICIEQHEHDKNITCFYEDQKPEIIKSDDFNIDTIIHDEDLINISLSPHIREHSRIFYIKDCKLL